MHFAFATKKSSLTSFVHALNCAVVVAEQKRPVVTSPPANAVPVAGTQHIATAIASVLLL